MADAFQPRFVDLVRNYSTTAGTSDFVLGPAVNGYTGFPSALSVGDRFYYSAVGVDKPAEREVGRGTLLANGVVRREPVSGAKTSFTSGTKSIALIAAAEWFDDVHAAVGAMTPTGQALANAQDASAARTALGLGSASMMEADADATLSADSDSRLATQKAVRTFAARFPLAAADRTALGSASTSAPVIHLREAGREGTFVFDSSNLSAKVAADTAQGIYVPPTSDTTGASGAWARKITGPLHPRHFGAPMNGVASDANALESFWQAFKTEGWKAGFNMEGQFWLDRGITWAGVGGNNGLISSLDFGLCRMTALTAISKMLTIQDNANANFEGQLQLVGTGDGSDVYSDWTCDAGLFIHTGAQATFSYLNVRNFGYAGVLTDHVSSNSDSMGIRKIYGVRCGSGSTAVATRSRTANWSGRTDSGASGATSQYSEITVDALPIAFAQANAANAPTYQLIVQIGTQLCFVTYIDPATNKLRLCPWIDGSATSGTLTYHYGAGVVLKGADAQLLNIGQIDFNVSGCAFESSAMFGSRVGIVHGEANGSLVRVAPNQASAHGGDSIGAIYSEGNSYRIVNVGTAGYGCDIGPQMGTDGPDKDYDLSAMTVGSPTSVTRYKGGFGAYTMTADKGGKHIQLKTYTGNNSAGEYLDFNDPATFRGKVFYCSGARTFTLRAPNASRKTQWGYDAARIVLIGSGIGGTFPGGITFNPPAGQTVNGGAAGAGFTFASTALSGPVVFVIVQTTATDWIVYPATAALSASPSAGIGYATGAGGTITQATSKSTGVTLNKICGQIVMNAAALAANASVAFTLTNSQIAATDAVIVTIASGATTNSYLTQVEATAAGSCRIQLRNISAGSLSEAVVLNFAVIKAVTA